MSTGANILHLERVFGAPRPLVFLVWTDPRHLGEWWGPAGYRSTIHQFEARPGGRIEIEMQGPSGGPIRSSGHFTLVEPPARLEFLSRAFPDEHGQPQLEVLNQVSFAEEGAGTRVTLSLTVVRASPAVDPSLLGMRQGWQQSLDRLEARLREVMATEF